MLKPKKKPVNNWNQHHILLPDDQKVKIREEIEQNCEWSTDTFYRKKRRPSTLKEWEKKFVAAAYQVSIAEFFPAQIKAKSKRAA